jgi:ketosteroid isomerase-like protein
MTRTHRSQVHHLGAGRHEQVVTDRALTIATEHRGERTLSSTGEIDDHEVPSRRTAQLAHLVRRPRCNVDRNQATGARDPVEGRTVLVRVHHEHRQAQIPRCDGGQADAKVFPQPGNPVTGRAAIREALAPFVALGGQIQLRTDAVSENGDLAVAYGEWTLTGGADPDGNPVNLEGRSTDVMRRQSDGSWLDAIDDPYSLG